MFVIWNENYECKCTHDHAEKCKVIVEQEHAQ